MRPLRKRLPSRLLRSPGNPPLSNRPSPNRKRKRRSPNRPRKPPAPNPPPGGLSRPHRMLRDCGRLESLSPGGSRMPG
ncbi:MAG: 50S ribosomal protein L32 [SAR324 cluster bacterium]|nr:50S ribosomal protein L32 [SAR324 cluster bacterium]